MTVQEPTEKSDFRKQLFLPAILLAVFLVSTFGQYFSVVLIDAAKSLQVSVGTVSQLAIISRFCGLAIGLVMAALTIRFKPKVMFLLGIALYGIGTLGAYFAPDFTLMLFFQFFLGIGGPIVGVLAYVLIGAYVPLQKRPWAIGLTLSTTYVAIVIVTFLSGIVAQAAGWRSFMCLFILPVSVAAIIMCFLILPSGTREDPSSTKPAYGKAFKQVLLNKSAISCLAAMTLISLFAVTPTYAPSFYRTQFDVSVATGGAFASGVAIAGIFGALIAGRIVNRVGRKTLTVLTAAISGVANIVFTFMPNIWLSVAFWGVAAGAVSFTWVSLFSLVIEQVPSYKNTMISINGTFRNLGAIIGLAVGGFVLNSYADNYQLLMVMFGSANVALALVVLFLTKDPCRNPLPLEH